MQWIVRMMSIPVLDGPLRQDAMTIPRFSIIPRPARAILMVCFVVFLAGCASRDRLRRPTVQMASHPAVFAVAPLFNESGTTISGNELASISDKLVSSINAVEGWSSVPFNRTLQAMKQLGLSVIQSDDDARAVCAVVGVDGLLVGTVTAWNPYDPPRFGANLLLIPASPTAPGSMDAAALYGRTGDEAASATALPASALEPIAITVDLDAVNHATRGELRRYAESHIDVTGGFDPPERYYLMVNDRWLDFAADMIIRDLVILESQRLARPTQSPS